MSAGLVLRALTVCSLINFVVSDWTDKNLPRVFLVTTDVNLDIYRASSHLSKPGAGEAGGSSPWSPAGVYVSSGEVNGFPYYTREEAHGDEEPLYSDMHVFRSKDGKWMMTNNTENFENDRGSFITSQAGDTPIGLKWRYHLFGKWPFDDSLAFRPYTEEYDSIIFERQLYSGPPKKITRGCINGTGNASDPGYSYTDTPRYFQCLSSSQYCYNDSAVFCQFDQDEVTRIVELLEAELLENSATLVVLEDEVDDLGGPNRIEQLRHLVQQELGLSAFRVYLTDPIFGFNTYVQIVDAVLLFSFCAAYGVAAGVFFSSASLKRD